jgi:hypothetical protein
LSRERLLDSSRRQPRSGLQDRRRTIISATRTTAHPAKQIATNKSGDMSRRPAFAAMKDKLQSRSDSNGANRVNRVSI